ncbi:MAG: TraG family conjugative transposon ATPase [Bacteroidota bacterium]
MLALSDHHLLLEIQNHRAYAANGDLILAYKLQLPESYSLGEQGFDGLYDSWYKAFRSLESGTIVLKQDVFWQKEHEGQPTSDSFLAKATQSHFEGRKCLSHTSYLFFIYTRTGSVLKNKAIQNPFRKLPKIAKLQEEHQHVQTRFIAEVERTVSFLNGQVELRLTPLKEEELHDYTRIYFNGLYEDRTTDSKREGNSFYIGDRRVGMYVLRSLKQLPESLSNTVIDPQMSSTDYQFYQGFVDGLGLGIPFDHIYTQVLFMADHASKKEELYQKQQHFHGARAFSPDNKIGAQQLESYLEEMAADERIRLIDMHANLCFFARNESEYDSFDKQVARVWKEMDIRPYYPTGNNLANLFYLSYMGYVSGMNHRFTIDLQLALCLFLNVSTYQEDEEGLEFTDRIFNLPIKRDVWDEKKKRIKARNFMIVAPTGEGKSFFASHLFRQYYEAGYYMVIHDMGDSYLKLCQLYPEGTLYIRYQEGEALPINPFSLENGLSASKLNELVNFVCKLWKRGQAATEEEIVSLRKMLKAFYQNVPDSHQFGIFYEFVELNGMSLLEELEIDPLFFDLQEFLHICSEFVGEGAYSYLLAPTEEHIDLNNIRFVVFELGAAKDDPLLLSLLLQMSADIKRKLIWEDRSKRGVIFYDEFARFLQYPDVLASVAYDFQAVRKYSGSVGVVLQSPSQLPSHDTSASMIDNTQVFYVLHNSKGYEAIVNRLGFSTHDHHQLMSLRNQFSGKQKYSEIFLKIGSFGNVIRLEVPLEVYAAYLTEGAAHEEIIKQYEESGDMQEAIQSFSESL